MAHGECQVGDLYYLDSHNEPCRIRQDIKRSGMLVRGFVDKSRTDITSDGNRGVSVKHAAGRERTISLAGNDARDQLR